MLAFLFFFHQETFFCILPNDMLVVLDQLKKKSLLRFIQQRYVPGLV